jgi:hypothetical protein
MWVGIPYPVPTLGGLFTLCLLVDLWKRKHKA